ncbi:MAG: hypothetical protein WBV74_12415, partial [Pseudonocardiaceae bacterium]
MTERAAPLGTVGAEAGNSDRLRPGAHHRRCNTPGTRAAGPADMTGRLVGRRSTRVWPFLALG